MGMKSSSGGGEIVEVQGGHIVRATGRKDRHSKVYTAKGPRDRRVRLSAHTAIQFYDVQDRLGYDRPSKAVDWLIKKAKSAIDKLAEAPQTFEPNAAAGLNAHTLISHQDQKPESSEYDFQFNSVGDVRTNQQTHFSSSLVAPLTNLDPDAMKSFFPTSSSNATINFQSYPHDIISRTTNPNEDLGLSLHPFQGNVGQAGSADQTLFTGGSAALSFDANFQRLSGWNSTELTPHENRSYMVNSQPSPPSMATLLNQQAMFLGNHQGPSSLLSHHHHSRGTLQSSFPQSFRSWGDHLSVDHQQKTQDHMDHNHHHHQQASVFGSQYGSHGIMQGFSIPTRIHGGEGEGIVAERPSSSSSSPPNSNH